MRPHFTPNTEVNMLDSMCGIYIFFYFFYVNLPVQDKIVTYSLSKCKGCSKRGSFGLNQVNEVQKQNKNRVFGKKIKFLFFMQEERAPAGI